MTKLIVNQSEIFQKLGLIFFNKLFKLEAKET